MRRLVLLGSLLVFLVSSPGPPSPAAADTGPWVWPVDGPREVSRPFAPPQSRYGSGHRGADLPSEPGAPVAAAGAGRVSYAGLLAGRGVVVVVHGELRTTYEPVTAAVSVGDRVLAGELLGRLEGGHAGCDVGACLHWGLRRGEAYLDPVRLVRPGPVRLLPVDGSGGPGGGSGGSGGGSGLVDGGVAGGGAAGGGAVGLGAVGLGAAGLGAGGLGAAGLGAAGLGAAGLGAAGLGVGGLGAAGLGTGDPATGPSGAPEATVDAEPPPPPRTSPAPASTWGQARSSVADPDRSLALGLVAVAALVGGIGLLRSRPDQPPPSPSPARGAAAGDPPPPGQAGPLGAVLQLDAERLRRRAG